MYLGVDLGNKKCGLAVQVAGVIIPKKICLRVQIIKEIRACIQKYNIHTIVVGLPYDLYGKHLRQLEKTEDFIEKLKKIFPEQKIVGVDERFTSRQADFLVPGEKGNKDDVAAGLILETFFSLNKGKN